MNVSSILTPGIRVIDEEEFNSLVHDGEIVFTIHGITESNVPGQKVSVGLATVHPRDKTKTGFVAEIYGHPGIQDDVMRHRVSTMVLQIFADENQVEGFAADDVYESATTVYEIGGQTVDLKCFVASGVCNLDGDYTCAMVCAILLPE